MEICGVYFTEQMYVIQVVTRYTTSAIFTDTSVSPDVSYRFRLIVKKTWIVVLDLIKATGTDNRDKVCCLGIET
jgi:hypothetical protein